MKRTPLSFVSLALLVLAGWQTVATLSRTPAFNRSLQVEDVDGRHYTGYAPPMYDRATYYRWMANGWRGYGAEDDLPGDPAVVEDAQRRLRDIAIRSLRYGPGDPTAWMQLAEAEAGLGDPASALVALERFYDLSLQNVARTAGRVAFLTTFLEDPDARAVALTELDPARIDADLRLLAQDKFLSGFAIGARDRLVAHGFELSPLPET